jgi:hypothetical protein
MPLPAPRQGESLGFHCQPTASDSGTLANPETIIWSSIRQLYSSAMAELVAKDTHNIVSTGDRRAAARNVALYVRQASEFYEAAQMAKPNTAPLIYYYSFLNLAKAICEFHIPQFHRTPECYRHGISWRPNPKDVSHPLKDQVNLTTRGVWHVLWESLSKRQCSAHNPTRLRIKDLFCYCPEISIEVDKTLLGPSRRWLELDEPDCLVDLKAKEAWLAISIHRATLRYQNLTVPKLLAQIGSARSGYTEVKSANDEHRRFQSAIPVKFTMRTRGSVWDLLEPDYLALNLFSYLDKGSLVYSIPLQTRLPLRIPQIVNSYTILFWLGSLVRYDPHSVMYLMDSGYWTLIDGFMSQSRIWLLEQFEWALYRHETTLVLTR